MPLQTIAISVTQNQIPSIIPRSDYRFLRIRVKDVLYDVRFVTGTGFVTFTLKPIDETVVEDSKNGSDQDDGGVVR